MHGQKNIKFVDNLNKINYKEKCASCWSFSRMCITMHGAENLKNVIEF